MTGIESLLARCAAVAVAALAAAAPAVSSGSPIPQKWLACEKDADCTAVELGCYHWQPVRRPYAAAMKRANATACTKSTPAGPMPPTSCARRECVIGPFTVGYWKLLGDQDHSPIQFRLIGERMNSCLRAADLEMSAKDRSPWNEIYFQRIHRLILEPGLPDMTLLDPVLRSVIACEELADWQRVQDKWERAQSNSPAAPRVRVEQIRKGYSFDDAYPPLIGYAKAFAQCGQTSTREGVRFWGDMQAEFSIRADGTVDPASLKATYPATAQMRQFIDCASSAFAALKFPAPADLRSASVKVLIQVPSNGSR
jgi:hypothetical protein